MSFGWLFLLCYFHQDDFFETPTIINIIQVEVNIKKIFYTSVIYHFLLKNFDDF